MKGSSFMNYPNYPYANGVIKALDNDILDYEKFQKLINLDQGEFFKTLIDLGYGLNTSVDLESLIKSEHKKIREMFNELAPNNELTDLFYLKNDAVNIKVLYKQKLFNANFDVFLETGTISQEDLHDAVFNENYTNLEKDYDKLFENIEKAIEDVDSSRLLSAKIDQEIYNFIFEKLSWRDEALLIFYKARIDLSNVLTMIRSTNLGWEKAEFELMFVDGGKISKDIFLEAYNADSEDIVRIFANHYEGKISKVFDIYFKNKDLNNFEKNLDELLLEIIAAFNYDSLTIGPIINYYMKKEAEAQNIRIIFANANPEASDLLKY